MKKGGIHNFKGWPHSFVTNSSPMSTYEILALNYSGNVKGSDRLTTVEQDGELLPGIRGLSAPKLLFPGYDPLMARKYETVTENITKLV